MPEEPGACAAGRCCRGGVSTFGLGPGGAALAVLLVWVGRQISVPYEGVMSSPQPSLGLGTPLGSRPKGMGQAERSQGER